MPSGWTNRPSTGTGGSFRCPTAYGAYQDLADCSKYWNCYNNQPSSSECPDRQLFDPRTSQCSGSINTVAGCTMPSGWSNPPSTGSGGSFRCPTAYGAYQDRADCSKYWNCYNNQPTSSECPDRQLFDPRTSQCSGAINTVAGCTMPSGWTNRPSTGSGGS
ncbi:aggregate silk glue 1 variant 1, partial [Elysia marginata]